MAKIHDIRTDYFEKGKSISEIAREKRIDRKTIRKYLIMEDWNMEQPKETAARPTILNPYLDIIRQWLEDDKDRRRKQRHTALRVYNRLVVECEYSGSYRTVADCVKDLKKSLYQEISPALPLEHRPGEAQADFGEADYYENGKRTSGAYLILSFPSSNAGAGQLVPGQNSECLVEALIALFRFLGGVPTRIWFDNASTMVTKVLKEGKRNIPDKFRRFQEHFGFHAQFCNPAAGHEKGNVENKVGYIRRNMLVPEPRFAVLSSFNQQLLELCKADWQREHYKQNATIAQLFEKDKALLLPVPHIPFDPAAYSLHKADTYGIVTIKNVHQYSTSPKYANAYVCLKFTAEHVAILDESHRPVVRHKRLYGKAKGKRMDWLPYLQQLAKRPGALKYTPIYEMMPNPLQQWINAQSKSQLGKTLALIADLTEKTGFKTACEAISDSIAHGITDGDSLMALHDRRANGMPRLPEQPIESHTNTPSVSFDPGTYDSMLTGGIQ